MISNKVSVWNAKDIFVSTQDYQGKLISNISNIAYRREGNTREANKLTIPYTSISAITVNDNVLTLTLNSSMDVPLGTITSISFQFKNNESAQSYALLVEERSPMATLHNATRTNASRSEVTNDMYVRFDTIPSSRFNLVAKLTLTDSSIKLVNRRGFYFEINYNNIREINSRDGMLYLVTKYPLHIFSQMFSFFIIYTQDAIKSNIDTSTYLPTLISKLTLVIN